MGLDVYDKEILKMTSDESGIRESYFHLADERAGKKLLYKIVQSLIPENTSPSTGSDLVSADNLFRFQSAVIRRLAQEESCIFIGRCADHVLAGTERLVRIFIYADMEARIQRIREKGYYEEHEIARNIRRMDRERRVFWRPGRPGSGKPALAVWPSSCYNIGSHHSWKQGDRKPWSIRR